MTANEKQLWKTAKDGNPAVASRSGDEDEMVRWSAEMAKNIAEMNKALASDDGEQGDSDSEEGTRPAAVGMTR